MLFLALIFVIAFATLTVVLWVATLFFQGYFYTEPTDQIHWQAPAAGGVLALFFMFWSFLLVSSPDATAQDIPYDTLFRFSPTEDMQKEPIRQIWVVRKGGKEEVLYKRHAEPGITRAQSVYKDTSFAARPYSPQGVEALLVEVDGKKLRFNLAKDTTEADYREFIAESGGWKIVERDRQLDDNATRFRWNRFTTSIILNVAHLLLWFVSLWLLLRFQWSHALGFALVFWLVVTLALLPMILAEAAARAAS